jgi:uncharacterized membrane protein
MSLEFNILDAVEVADPDTLACQLALFGRIGDETVCVFAYHPEFYIYLAASPDWQGHVEIAETLEAHLRLKNKTAFCQRTLCPYVSLC